MAPIEGQARRRPEQPTGVGGGLPLRLAREARVQHVGDRHRHEAHELRELRRHGVGAHHGGAREHVEEREVETQVEQREHGADLATRAVPPHLTRQRDRREPDLEEVAAARQAAPRHQRGQCIGREQRDDDQERPADAGEPEHAVGGKEHQLLEHDHLVRARKVAAALRRPLGCGHDQLREHGAPGEHHEAPRQVGEEYALDHAGAGGPEQRADDARDQHDHDHGGPESAVMGLREEVRHAGGQATRHHDAHQPREHSQQREHADATRTGDACDDDRRDAERHQRQRRARRRSSSGCGDRRSQRFEGSRVARRGNRGDDSEERPDLPEVKDLVEHPGAGDCDQRGHERGDLWDRPGHRGLVGPGDRSP